VEGIGLGDEVIMSLPTRERGLKYLENDDFLPIDHVAPHTGAWIEISVSKISVAPD